MTTSMAKGLEINSDEAAQLLGIYTETLRGYIREAQLPAYRIVGERAIRIKRKDIEGLLEPYQAEDE